MSAVMDAPAATGTRLAELTRDGVTLRLSVTDGQPWIALEREHEGRLTQVAMPLDTADLGWLDAHLYHVMTGIHLAGEWEVLEP